jgi:protease-4
VRLRESGKTVVALLDLATLNATRELLLASAASKVYVVPGYLGPLAGLSGEFLFLSGFLDKLGIQFEYERVGDYKSAPEMFAAREMSEPARRNANALFDGLFDQLVTRLAVGRGLSPERVRALVAAAPGTADEIVEAKLADGVATKKEALRLAGLEDAPEVRLDTYLHVDPRDLGLRDGPTIALVFGDGTIVPGPGGRSQRFAADPIAKALREAGEDDDVAAIVLRINSGGGSPLASELLWSTVREVTEEKPVVVSMADAAASGGYYVASAGNAIFAEPGTLTGSIGVFLIRPAYRGLYEKLGVQTETLARGPFASVSGGSGPFTPEQRARTKHFVHALYSEFLERVATGRGIDVEQVDRVAQGQVWLGDAALELGLIDGLGGLHAAVARAKQEAGIDADVDPRRAVFPGPRSIGEQVRGLMRGELRTWLVRQVMPFELPSLFAALAESFEGGVAYLPSWWIEFD